LPRWRAVRLRLFQSARDRSGPRWTLGKAWPVTEQVPRYKLVLAQLVVVLMLAFIVFGLAWYGFSTEVRGRIWQNLVDRPGGPMVFRFVLQPVMAAIAAFRDGLKDARSGRAPFLVTILTDPQKRTGRLNEALVATAQIILLGLIMDAIYQFKEFDTFHPAEAVIIALLLAFLPYLLLRGLFALVARKLIARNSSSEAP
jgi:hypothetical protein